MFQFLLMSLMLCLCLLFHECPTSLINFGLNRTQLMFNFSFRSQIHSLEQKSRHRGCCFVKRWLKKKKHFLSCLNVLSFFACPWSEQKCLCSEKNKISIESFRNVDQTRLEPENFTDVSDC